MSLSLLSLFLNLTVERVGAAHPAHHWVPGPDEGAASLMDMSS